MTAPLKLVGDCNQCGRCCEPVVQGRRMRCIFLAHRMFTGFPGATTCQKYAERRPGMRITLHDVADARFAVEATCGAPGTEQETQAILDHGIGRGCSLEVVHG
jgi:hypothetical protein